MSATGKMKATKFNGPKMKGKIVGETDSPFSWFPELENIFRNFDIDKLEFTLDNKEKTTFVIIKED